MKGTSTRQWQELSGHGRGAGQARLGELDGKTKEEDRERPGPGMKPPALTPSTIESPCLRRF